MNEMHQSNQRYWDALAPDWKALRDKDGLWRLCPQQPELAFDGEALAMIRRYVGDLHGKRVCVVGSGDNYVAIALAGMGARVTSADISTRQLVVAHERARLLGLEIVFKQTDATMLDGIGENEFDLVCSSNGFFVWIAEPGGVFNQVYRVLRPGGFYIFYDVHPFQRPWKDQKSPIEMEKPYTETGPFKYEESGQTTYEYHWRISDLINSLIEAGLILCRVAESTAKDARFWEGAEYTSAINPDLADWNINPRAGLPVWLSLAAQKPKR